MTMKEFILRPWTFDDLPDLIRFADNPDIAKYMSDKFINPYTKDQGKRFLDFAINTIPQRIFAIDIAGQAIGAIGIHPQSDIYCRNAELGYWLAEPFWGKGIMTLAIQQMVEYGFKTWELNRIFARPFGGNMGSQRALEKAGFVLEGRFEQSIFKNGEYIDELVFAKRK
ncbi:GNAT family N-acetyltransferase [soil metagenome]